MVSVSLLQRLGHGGASVGTTKHTDDSAVFESILHNLQMILNSRRDCCETRPDFGLSDFNATGDYRSALVEIARDVERQIRTFEPRLRNVFVQPVPDKARVLEYLFHIDAELADKDRTVRVRFDSVLGADGQVRFNS